MTAEAVSARPTFAYAEESVASVLRRSLVPLTVLLTLLVIVIFVVSIIGT